MKKNLGSLLLFILFLETLHAAKLCDYHFKISNPTPYIKEGVDITFSAAQLDQSAVMFFDLKAPKSPDYTLIFLHKSENNSHYHDKRVAYHYRLYPLKAGELLLDFNFSISQTSDKSMEKFASGDRDIIKPMLKEQTNIPLKPLHIHVKPLKKEVTLIGDFTLKMALEKSSLHPFEQLNLSYTLKGSGYPSTIKQLLPKIEGVESFLELEEKKGVQHFSYALLADSNFTIPEVNISCFSPKRKRYYTLHAPAQKITILAQKESELVDSKDSLPKKAFSFDAILPYLNGLLLFIAGYFTAHFQLFNIFQKKSIKKDTHQEKIASCKDAKSLLQLLLSLDSKAYKKEISLLEDALYHDRAVSLKDIKEQLLKR
jgi:hypothetical protein